MISLLIPVFNHDSSRLIRVLCRQAGALDIDWELIAMEDGSTEFTAPNRMACEESEHAFYIYNKENVGRAAIRNRLARAARGKWLIFMDCDSAVGDTRFLSHYVEAIRKAGPSDILCGGRSYRNAESYPSGCRLHWLVGSHREPCVSAGEPVRNFTSNNFAVRRDFFLAHPFDETIRTYGHEDTLFGFQATREGGRYAYVNAPVIHDTLDLDADFLAKTEQGVRNLAAIERRLLPDEVERIPLLRAKNRLVSLGLLGVLRTLAPVLLPLLKRLLLSPLRSLKAFDLYKITLMSTLF